MAQPSLAILQRHAARRRALWEAERQSALCDLRKALHEVLPGQAVYVFGSILCPGGFRPDSDVDLALPAEPQGQSLYAVQARLEEAVGRSVDVVLLSESRLYDKIMREGELWTS